MKIGYWKNTIADIGRAWSSVSWLTRLTDNTHDSTSYSNKSQCWTAPNLKYLIMMLTTEKKYCITALTSYLEIMIGITQRFGSCILKEVETLNQNQHDPSAELLASVDTK